VRLHQLAAELEEPAPGVNGPQVGKWERGARNPGRYYKPRLCLVFEAMPEQIGLTSTPRLMQDVGDLARRRIESQPSTSPGVVHAAGAELSETAFPHVDRDRLASALRYLWPADKATVEGLARAGRQLSHRADSEPPYLVLPDLREYLDSIQQLLSRSQPRELASHLMLLASRAAMHAGDLHDSGGDWSDAYMNFAVAESLAREAGSGSQLAMVFINKAEMYRRRAHVPENLRPAVALTEAAWLAVEPDAPPGLRAWILGERAAHEAEMGDDLASGRDLEHAYRVAAGVPAAEMNLFSDLESQWLDHYRGLRALRVGQLDEAIAVYTAVLRDTDPQLLWEQGRALYRLAATWALKGEVERACDLLRQAANLTAGSGDRRGLEQVLRVRERLLGKWRTDPHVRELDDAIREARALAPKR
jgi:tetratricopeptide (TPR) repeat protein